MCLNLGGTQQALKPVAPPTDKAKHYRKILIVLAVINFALAFMYCFVNLLGGFYEFIVVAILGCSISSMNYCCLAMYMIYITLNWITNVCSVGLIIQNGYWSSFITSGNTTLVFQITLSMMFIIYYTIAFVLCFLAYREFKAMLMDV
jgi:hypothetical protein